jgi:dihydroceramidase
MPPLPKVGVANIFTDPMQLVDELSMIYTTCIMCFATFSYGRSTSYSIILSVFLVGLAAFITGYYHYLQDPKFHQNMYALLTAVVLFRSVYVMEVNIRPSLRAKETVVKEVNANGHANGIDRSKIFEDARDVGILRTMWLMIAWGLGIFLGGFALWNVDNIYCSTLRNWRREIGLPWGILLEGHGWW